MNYERALQCAIDYARSQHRKYVVTVSQTENETEKDTYCAVELYRAVHFGRYSDGIVTHINERGLITSGPLPLSEVIFEKSPYRGMIQAKRNDFCHMRDADKMELIRRWKSIADGGY
jgi:hypothetical protein